MISMSIAEECSRKFAARLLDQSTTKESEFRIAGSKIRLTKE